jgi:LPXTG-site transpeptidase (sortase) family protein
MMARGTRKVHGYNWRRRGLLCIGIASIVGLSAMVLLSFKASKNPAPRVNPPKKIAAPSPPKAINYGLPVRLKIPKLAVDAPITYLGLAKNGDMAAPTNITDVGWYKDGSLPGNKGSAVLDGHLDGLKGKPGVFASLDKLQKGDSLQVIDSNGTVISFTVREIRKYREDEQPSEVFTATNAARLNLITCSGTWNNAQNHYMERLVVFTDKTG